MDPTTGAVLVIGGVIVFYIAIRVVSSLTSRGIDKAFDAGSKVINKKRNAEIEEIVAVPLVLTSSASAEEITDSIDAMVQAKKGAPGLATVVYESGRTADKITFAMGNRFYPQQYVVEVQLGQRDGSTQVIAKTLHLAVNKDGDRPGADALMILRHSIEFAVMATGDPDKMAAGLKLNAPPEPGTPRATENTIDTILTVAGGGLVIYVLFKFQTGLFVSEVPLHIGLLILGVAIISAAQWMERRAMAARRAEQLAILSGAAPASLDEAPAGVLSPLAGAGAALGSGASTALAWASHSSRKNKLVLVAVVLALVTFGGFAMSSARSGLSAIVPGLATDDNPGGTGGDYTPEDYVAPEASSDGAVPMNSKDLAYFLSTNENPDICTVDVTWEGDATAQGDLLWFTTVGAEYPEIYKVTPDPEWLYFVDAQPSDMDTFLKGVRAATKSDGFINYSSEGVASMSLR